MTAESQAIGPYTPTQAIGKTRVADWVRATGPGGRAVTLAWLHAPIWHLPAVRAAHAALPVATSRLGLAIVDRGEHAGRGFVALAEFEGVLMRDLLRRKKQAGGGGFGARGAAGVLAALAPLLVEHPHGALTSESIAIGRGNRLTLVDHALAPIIAAAAPALADGSDAALAPELTRTPPDGASDVYGLGALLYEMLIGDPLARGGARPSEVVPGLSAEVDPLIARACHRDPAARFGGPAMFADLAADALAQAEPVAAPTPTAARPSLAQSIAAPSAEAALATGNPAADRAMAAALADSTEKWLVSKGKFDYGPFALADIIVQINRGDIVAGNVIIDKDTGARMDVAEQPLLAPLIDAAKVTRDDARRAQAEVAHQSREKRRGATLYALIGAGVLGVGGIVYLVVRNTGEAKTSQVASVSTLGSASLNVKLSPPKAAAKATRRPGGGGGGGGGGAGGPGQGQSEDLSLDMSGDDDGGGETLSMDQVYNSYARYGGQLGGCLSSNGTSSASISMSIDGRTGKVTFVRVNGQTSGGLWSCLNRVMRSIKFPIVDGNRTRVEFDIGV